MYIVGICDDEKSTCRELEKIIYVLSHKLKTPVTIMTWNSGNRLLSDLEEGINLDILFLDIKIPDIDGVSIGRVIREKNNYTMPLIYISSNETYALKLFENMPIGFLIKPLTSQAVGDVLLRAFKLIKKEVKIFEYTIGTKIHRVKFDTILYITGSLKKIQMCFNDGEKVEFYAKIKDVVSQLPEEFMVIHKSIVINKTYVKSYGYEEVIMIDNTRHSISKSNRSIVRAMIISDKREGENFI